VLRPLYIHSFLGQHCHPLSVLQTFAMAVAQGAAIEIMKCRVTDHATLCIMQTRFTADA